MIEYIFLTLLWVILVPLSITVISNNSSKIGLYHISYLYHFYSCDNRIDGDKLEPFLDKYIESITCNFKLSALFIVAFYGIIITSGIGEATKIKEALILSFALTIIILIIMRQMSNPSKKLFKPIMLELVTNPNVDQKKKIERIITDIQKERIMSFFFSFFSAAILISLIFISYDIVAGNYNQNTYGIEKLNQSETVSSKYFNIFTEPNMGDFIVQTIPFYIIFLLLSTLISELILFFLQPLRQYPLKKARWITQSTIDQAYS